MILVVGATGLLGGEICRRLSERGQPVRALARRTSDTAMVQRLKSLGAEIVQGLRPRRPDRHAPNVGGIPAAAGHGSRLRHARDHRLSAVRPGRVLPRSRGGSYVA
jgi:nucleoside-diphosphate-sugar epimerase